MRRPKPRLATTTRSATQGAATSAAGRAGFYNSPTGKKSLSVAGNLMREGMEAANRDLTPKIEKLMEEAREEYERARPWSGTMADIRLVATALEAYSIDEGSYPMGDYASLEAVLVPTYIKELPEKDRWGHPYVYVVSTDRQHYRVVSAGADSVVNWDSKRIVPREEDVEIETRYSDRLEDDLIFTDGNWDQAPVQAKPED